jgi:hypothetical protein
MKAAETQVVISCSRFQAINQFVFIPVLAVMAATWIFIAVVIVLWGDLASPDFWPFALVFPVCLLLPFHICCHITSVVRNRESLFTEFIVSSTGINVSSPRYFKLSLGWNDVTRATYSRLLETITLESPRLAHPLAIMNLVVRKGRRWEPDPAFVAALELIEGGIGARLRKVRLF